MKQTEIQVFLVFDLHGCRGAQIILFHLHQNQLPSYMHIKWSPPNQQIIVTKEKENPNHFHP